MDDVMNHFDINLICFAANNDRWTAYTHSSSGE